MAFGLAVYASQGRLPDTTQDSLPVAGQALLDGVFTRKVPMKDFKVVIYILFLLPKLSWRNRCNRCLEGRRILEFIRVSIAPLPLEGGHPHRSELSTPHQGRANLGLVVVIDLQQPDRRFSN